MDSWHVGMSCLRRVFGLGEVLGEENGCGRRERRREEGILDDGTAGSSIGGQVEKELDNVCVSSIESEAESKVVSSGSVDATLQRQIEEKLDDVRVAVPGSKAESVVVDFGRLDTTPKWQIKEKLDDALVSLLGSEEEGGVAVCARVDATLLNKVSHRGEGASRSSCCKRGCVTGNDTCLAQVLQDNVSVLHHVPLVTNSSARRLLLTPNLVVVEGADLARPVKAVLGEDGDG